MQAPRADLAKGLDPHAGLRASARLASQASSSELNDGHRQLLHKLLWRGKVSSSPAPSHRETSSVLMAQGGRAAHRGRFGFAGRRLSLVICAAVCTAAQLNASHRTRTLLGVAGHNRRWRHRAAAPAAGIALPLRGRASQPRSTVLRCGPQPRLQSRRAGHVVGSPFPACIGRVQAMSSEAGELQGMYLFVRWCVLCTAVAQRF